VSFFGKLFGRKEEPAASPATRLAESAQARAALNLGQLWHIVEEIAREDGHTGPPVVEHYNLTNEGKKDVDRWMQIHLKRLNPGHPFRLPDHHVRHRGYCLVPRVWPDGLRWHAVDDETLFRAPIPEEPTREALRKALDAFLDGAEGHPQ